MKLNLNEEIERGERHERAAKTMKELCRQRKYIVKIEQAIQRQEKVRSLLEDYDLLRTFARDYLGDVFDAFWNDDVILQENEIGLIIAAAQHMGIKDLRGLKMRKGGWDYVGKVDAEDWAEIDGYYRE